ncbi:HTH-type transcriptional activator RhaR [compost metagenome]
MESTPLVSSSTFLAPEAHFAIHHSRETPFLMQHMHDFIEVACVTEGEGIHYIQNKNYSVSAGDVFVIPPGISHVFQPLDLSGKEPLRVINILLNIDSCSFLTEEYGSGTCTPIA